MRKGLDNVHGFYNKHIEKYVKTIPDATGKKIAKEFLGGRDISGYESDLDRFGGYMRFPGGKKLGKHPL